MEKKQARPATEYPNPSNELALMINETVASLQDLQSNLSAYGGSELTTRQKDCGKLVINSRIFAVIDEMKHFVMLPDGVSEIENSIEYVTHLVELRRYLD